MMDWKNIFKVCGLATATTVVYDAAKTGVTMLLDRRATKKHQETKKRIVEAKAVEIIKEDDVKKVKVKKAPKKEETEKKS